MQTSSKDNFGTTVPDRIGFSLQSNLPELQSLSRSVIGERDINSRLVLPLVEPFLIYITYNLLENQVFTREISLLQLVLVAEENASNFVATLISEAE